jgi:hypothetical protein
MAQDWSDKADARRPWKAEAELVSSFFPFSEYTKI